MSILDLCSPWEDVTFFYKPRFKIRVGQVLLFLNIDAVIHRLTLDHDVINFIS